VCCSVSVLLCKYVRALRRLSCDHSSDKTCTYISKIYTIWFAAYACTWFCSRYIILDLGLTPILRTKQSSIDRINLYTEVFPKQGPMRLAQQASRASIFAILWAADHRNRTLWAPIGVPKRAYVTCYLAFLWECYGISKFSLDSILNSLRCRDPDQ
jgi:hypothetical protein